MAAGVIVPFCVGAGLQSWHADQALRAHRVCTLDLGADCLVRARGQLQGPFSVGRSVNESWQLWQGLHEVDAFEVGPDDSDRLSQRGSVDVSALLYDNDVMVVELPDGGEVRTTFEGARGMTQWGCAALTCLGAMFGFYRYSRKKWNYTGGWWAVAGGPDPSDLPAVLVAMPGLFCFCGLLVGLSWWASLLLTVPAMGGVVWSMVRRRR